MFFFFFFTQFLAKSLQAISNDCLFSFLFSVLVRLRSMRCGTVERGSTFLGTDRRDPPPRRDECSTFNFGYLRKRWAFRTFDPTIRFLIANHFASENLHCGKCVVSNQSWILLVLTVHGLFLFSPPLFYFFFFCSIMKQFFDSILVYRFKMRINKIVYVILLISLSLSV